jgi:hypothetical protein
MIGRPDFRQRDIQWGCSEALIEAKIIAKRMFEEEKITSEQLEDFLKRFKENEEKNSQRTMNFLSGNLTSNGDEEKEEQKEEVFNKSTLLTLMKERLKVRQTDIDWGRAEGIEKAMNSAQRMFEERTINQEQLDEFLKHIEEDDEKK